MEQLIDKLMLQQEQLEVVETAGCHPVSQPVCPSVRSHSAAISVPLPPNLNANDTVIHDYNDPTT